MRETEMLKFYNSNMYIHIEYQCRDHPSPDSQKCSILRCIGQACFEKQNNQSMQPLQCMQSSHHITLQEEFSKKDHNLSLSAQPQEELFTTFCVKASYTKNLHICNPEPPPDNVFLCLQLKSRIIGRAGVHANINIGSSNAEKGSK